MFRKHYGPTNHPAANLASYHMPKILDCLSIWKKKKRISDRLKKAPVRTNSTPIDNNVVPQFSPHGDPIRQSINPSIIDLVTSVI
jgi:hypothetical protein